MSIIIEVRDLACINYVSTVIKVDVLYSGPKFHEEFGDSLGTHGSMSHNHGNNIILYYNKQPVNKPEPDYIITNNKDDKDPRCVYIATQPGVGAYYNSKFVSYSTINEIIDAERIKRYGLEKTQLKLLMNYDMESLLIRLDKEFTKNCAYYTVVHIKKSISGLVAELYGITQS